METPLKLRNLRLRNPGLGALPLLALLACLLAVLGPLAGGARAQTPVPQQISGLTAWWTAGAPTTLTNSTVATTGTGAITDGTLVAQWFDASGNGNTMTQATGANQPTYHTGGHLGSQPYVTFDTTNTHTTGAGAWMTCATSFLNTLSGGTGTGSYTFLFLVYKANTAEATFQILAANATGASHKYFFTRISNNFTRYNGTATTAMSEGAGHGLAYTFAASGANTGTETLYEDSAATAASSATGGTPAENTGQSLTLGSSNSGANSFNGEFYQVLVYNRALSSSEIAQIYGYWNGIYGTSYNTNAGPLTSPSLTASNVQQTSQTLSWGAAVGGTAPFTYALYRSTSSGVQGGQIYSGTATTFGDTGLTAQRGYYYQLTATDSAGTPATVTSTQIYAPTHGTKVVKIGFLGDSITAYSPGGVTPAQQFANDLFLTYPSLDPQILNLAVAGQKVRDLSRVNSGSSLITGYVTSLTSFGPTYVLWMEGTNDADAQNSGTSGFTTSNFTSDNADVLSALTTAGFKVVLNDIMYRATTATDTIIQAYNTARTGLVNGTSIIAGSTTDYNYFAAHASELTDGLHPTGQGVTDLALQWFNADKGLFAPASLFRSRSMGGPRTGTRAAN